MVIFGAYILLFFAHLALFFIHRSYRTNLWLALLCLVWAARTGVTGYKPFLTLFSWFSWGAALRIEYISIPLAVTLLTAVYHILFPGVLQKISPHCGLYSKSVVYLAVSVCQYDFNVAGRSTHSFSQRSRVHICSSD